MPLGSFSGVGASVEAAVGDSGSAGGALADGSGGAAWLALAFPTDGCAVKDSGKLMLGGIDLLVFSRSDVKSCTNLTGRCSIFGATLRIVASPCGRRLLNTDC